MEYRIWKTKPNDQETWRRSLGRELYLTAGSEALEIARWASFYLFGDGGDGGCGDGGGGDGEDAECVDNEED